ncbi:hypothetical protein [Streptomyces sp. cmx-18-6]|uniref:DUF7847 domain-containing protein n=1 Tax=Streptomyces sp. cmx-18-6 TaxID=2790930 RepID=UPI003980B458
MLTGAFSTIGRYWKPLTGMVLALFGAATAVMAAAVLVAISAIETDWDALTDPGTPAEEQLVPLGIALGVLMAVGVLVYLLASAVMQAAVPVILQEAVLGRPLRFAAVWSRAWSRVWAMIGTVFLVGLIIAVPLLFIVTAFLAFMVYVLTLGDEGGFLPLVWVGLLGWLALGPLALWLWTKFSLAPTIVVFEGQGPVAALRRSAQLVRDNWWRIFGISLLAYAIAGVAGYLVQMVFQMIGMLPGVLDTPNMDAEPTNGEIAVLFGGILVLALLSHLVSYVFSAVFPPLVIGLLYVDRRIRAENLGPVLAEAADRTQPPQYGSPPPAHA